MKQVLILGAGTAGTMTANRLHRLLNLDEWHITIVDQDETHYYQPGFLFIPFGTYREQDVIKPKRDFMPPDIEFIISPIKGIDAEHNQVTLKQDGRVLTYDFLIIATGAQIRPDQTSGLVGSQWHKTIHDFYTLDGALALSETLSAWQGGRLLVNVVENPIKCPVAPLEFLMLADAFFQAKGIRERVELIYATPLPGAFTKPIAAQHLGKMLLEKDIHVVPEFSVEHVDPAAKKIVSYDEQTIEYDLLVSVPLNMGAQVIARSGLGDESNFIPVDKHTFVSPRYANIFALGDAAALPISKAGSVAHFAVECFAENFLRYAEGSELMPNFDGHANCFIESGFGKGMLIDFNYTTEPLPGKFPVPHIGPFSLLSESHLNHLGKLAFRWMYWNILLKGYNTPLPAQMSLAGKVIH